MQFLPPPGIGCPPTGPNVDLGEDERRRRLSPQASSVLRKESTEGAGTSPLDPEKRTGAFETRHDFRLFTQRTEYHCARGGGHHRHGRMVQLVSA